MPGNQVTMSQWASAQGTFATTERVSETKSPGSPMLEGASLVLQLLKGSLLWECAEKVNPKKNAAREDERWPSLIVDSVEGQAFTKA